MDPITRARDLGRRYFDGLLGEPELHELQALLQGNPDAADAFARLSRLEGDLAELFAREQDIRRESGVLDAIGRQGRRRRWLGWTVRLAVAACLLVAVLVPLLWWLGSTKDDSPGGEAVVVSGWIEHSEGVAWVMSNEAVVRLADGSEVRLEKDSEVVLPTPESRRLFELRSGKGRFVVTKAQEPFRVETPAGLVTVLGTEFTVTVTHEREDESMKLSHVMMSVVVLSGLVQVERGDDVIRLGGGQSRVFGEERKEERKKEGDRRTAVRAQRAMVVSAGDGKLTVVVGGDGGREEKTLDVGDKVKVFIDGKAAKLSDLTKGMLVAIERGTKDGDGVVAVRAQGPTFEAVVKAVAKDKITVAARGREEQEYPLVKEARVTIDGKAGKLSDIKEGDRIGVGLSADKKSVIALVKGRGEREGDRRPGVSAKVKSIDLKERTITLPGRGDNERVLKLAKDIKVTIDGKEGKLEDIKEGTVVGLELDREGKTVTAITVGRGGREREGERGRPGRVVGKVKGAEKTDSTITLAASRRQTEDQLFAVAKDAKITIDGKAAKLEDIKEGMTATLTLDRDKKTVKEIAIGGERKREGDREKNEREGERKEREKKREEKKEG